MLLEKHVRGGLVDYAGFKADERDLDPYLDHPAAVDHEALPPKERLAFLSTPTMPGRSSSF